jgi:hypothetical protein
LVSWIAGGDLDDTDDAHEGSRRAGMVVQVTIVIEIDCARAPLDIDRPRLGAQTRPA